MRFARLFFLRAAVFRSSPVGRRMHASCSSASSGVTVCYRYAIGESVRLRSDPIPCGNYNKTDSTKYFEDPIFIRESLNFLYGLQLLSQALFGMFVSAFYAYALHRTRITFAELLKTLKVSADRLTAQCSEYSMGHVRAAKNQYHKLGYFVLKTRVSVTFLLFVLIARSVANWGVAVGYEVGPADGCERRCRACQSDAFVFATVLEYQPAVNFGILLTQPLRFLRCVRREAPHKRIVEHLTMFDSMIIGLWGMLPPSEYESPRDSKRPVQNIALQSDQPVPATLLSITEAPL